MSTSVSLASIRDLAESIRHARNVELDAYVLQNPFLLYSLEAAAHDGADVVVQLGDPGQASQRATNYAAMRALTAAGAHVSEARGFGPEAMHAKIAIVDGTAYLDDRNFTGEETETIVVARGHASAHDYLMTKAAALAQEADFIKRAVGHDVLFSTESLGPSPVVDALIERASHGDDVRVMYDRNMSDTKCAEAVAALRAAGAHVRAAAEKQSHKMAIVGDSAWIGSANASPGADEQQEWGLTVPVGVAAPLRDTYEYCWWKTKSTA